MSLIREDLISNSKYARKCPYTMNPIGIAIHNTYNDAPAKNEASYMKSNNNQVSFHIVVDDIEAIKVIPFNRNAWACGDGSGGNGNRKYISLEICYSKSGGTKFANSEKLASKVVAEICKDYGWGIDKVKAHRDFAKKDCPHRTSMDAFKKMVENELRNNSNQEQTKLKFENGDYSSKKARVATDVLNVRWNRGTNFEVIGQVKKGQIVNLNYCVDKWISIEGFSGNKGLGYVHTDYLELI